MYDANDLRLRDSNPYAGGEVLIRPEGTAELTAAVVGYVPGPNDRFHPALRQGEALDQLAYEYWKDEVEDAERYWWVLALVNRIDQPLNLAAHVGRRLLIPDIIRYKLLLASQ